MVPRVPKRVRPRFFSACRHCKEATRYLNLAELAAPNNALALTVACGDIHKQSNAHPGTAVMKILALKSEGEAGDTDPVYLGSGEGDGKSVTVYCAGGLKAK